MSGFRKILVVDDIEINRTILRKILEADYDLMEAKNGKEALAILAENVSNISLILLDLAMPIMDGYAFLEYIKKNNLYSSIPIVVTTQSDGEEDEIHALSAGASDFIVKPYNPEIIRHRIGGLINLCDTYVIMNSFEYDKLTGLYTKEMFVRKVAIQLEENPGKEYDIICSDIENFKLVNDLFGEKIADDLLEYIAKYQKRMIGKNDICGRFGPDIFVSLVEHQKNYEHAYFEKINCILNHFGIATNLVMKFGIYSCVDRNISVPAMCDRALLAVNTVKNVYGTYFAYYNDEIRHNLLNQQQILDSMEMGIEKKEFKVFYQPKYNIRTNQISGAEALVRWEHPRKGFLLPGAFIPLFEKNGFISRLDRYVWEETCFTIRKWIDAGNEIVPISVNVSRADLYNVSLPKILKELINKYHLDPSYLHLEITESAYTDNPRQIIDTVKVLRNMGFIIEMDDFGAGYSSLNMLSDLPIDVLKMDMNFVHNVGAADNSKSIMSFVISLGKWMGVQVLAEGVETEEQFKRLLAMDCHFVQGYYFAKPMPEKEFFELLLHSNLYTIKPNDEIASNAMSVFTKVTKNEDEKKIMLIVDDVELHRSIIKDLFLPYYTIAETGNGAAALTFLRKQAANIEIVLLDLVMPIMDGFQVLEIMRKEEQLKDIPVIVTSEAGENSEVDALNLGAEDFIAKPYNSVVMAKHIRNVIDSATLRKQRKQIERQHALLQEVYLDYLTGTLNRRGFDDAWEKLPISCNGYFALYLLDVDNFKEYNDTRGHNEGDTILKEFGNELQGVLRSDDIVARLGGDEFAVLIQNMDSKEAVQKKGSMMCKKLRIQCSIGVTVFENKPPTMQALLKEADIAMYIAKKRGKNNCYLYDEKNSEQIESEI